MIFVFWHFTLKKKCTPLWQIYTERSENVKSVSKEELNILIQKGVLINSGEGYIDPIRHAVVGHYRTSGSAKRVYIEDIYADKAKELFVKN